MQHNTLLEKLTIKTQRASRANRPRFGQWFSPFVKTVEHLKGQDYSSRHIAVALSTEPGGSRYALATIEKHVRQCEGKCES